MMVRFLLNVFAYMHCTIITTRGTIKSKLTMIKSNLVVVPKL